jgi:hypothetical protein
MATRSRRSAESKPFVPHRIGWIATCTFLLLTAGGLQAEDQPSWAPVDPALIAETAPRIDADAPAEIVSWQISIDDRDFPTSRWIRETIRYKIFDPARAANFTRISILTSAIGGEQRQRNEQIDARLVLPDGTTRTFGAESIQERPIAHQGPEDTWVNRLLGEDSVSVNQRFLAVSGIAAGSVLDFRLSHEEVRPAAFAHFVLQRDIPIRHVEIFHRINSDESDLSFQSFVLNRGAAQARGDPRAHRFSLSADDLPALVTEPFSGPVADRALTYVAAYRQNNLTFLNHHSDEGDIVVDPKSGPWAPYATRVYFVENDMARASSRLHRVALQLTAGAQDPVEKARLIHRYVQDVHRRFLLVPRPAVVRITQETAVDSLDEVAEFEKYPNRTILPEDFQWLEVGMLRSIGLDAHTVLLPNRSQTHFDPRLSADAFLPTMGLCVSIGGKLQFSYPGSNPRIPFGMLPWTAEGQVGLIAAPNRQEFVEVPLTPAENSVIANSGTFHLEPDGTLIGDCTRSYTGQYALQMRTRFGRGNGARDVNVLRAALLADFRSALVRITATSGTDVDDAPVTVNYRMRIRGYAVVTKDRIIFKPAVFHSRTPSPFSSPTRRYLIEFPFQWMETDRVAIRLPAGFALETKSSPPSMPGPVLSYRTKMSFEPSKNVVHADREFISRAMIVASKFYPALKQWYDNVAASDQAELVIARTGPPPAPSAEPAEPDGDQPPAQEPAPGSEPPAPASL